MSHFLWNQSTFICVRCFSAVVLLWIATHTHKLEPLAYLQRRQESSQKLTCFLIKLPNIIIYGPQTSVLEVSAQEESGNRVLLVLQYLEARFQQRSAQFSHFSQQWNVQFAKTLCYGITYVATVM